MTDYNPHELNIQFDIQIRTIDNTTGEDVEAWATAYSGVWGRRLAPPRGSESDEANQNVSIQRDSFKIRKEGRSITAKNHRIVMGGEKFYIENIRPFKSSLDYLVLDTEKRDNDVGSDPVTSLILANADQTKSSGAAIDTVTATTDQDAVFFATDLPAGCTLTKTSGTTATVTGTAPGTTAQFTITALGVDGGLYSKTVDITISGVSGTLWTPSEGLDGGTVVVGFDLGDNVTSASSLISSIGSEYGESINATQSTDDNKPIVGTMANGKACAVFTGDNALEFTLSSAPSQQFDVWIGAEAAFYSSFGHLIGDGVDDNLNFLATLQRAAIVVNGTSINMNVLTDEIKAEINCKPCIYHAKVLSQNFEINLNGGETMAATSGTTNTGGWPTTLSIGARSSNGGLGAAANIGLVLITTGAITATDIEKIEGWMAYVIGSQSFLRSDHPYKVNPPTV